LFCHRKPGELEEADVADLFDSLITEGLQQPVEFYTHKDGRKILIKGHRRVKACRLLAEKNTPNFSLNMQIPAIEVFEAPLKDLVIRSVLDNTARKSLDNVGRILAARALHENGVEDKRAAIALGVSRQAYERDLLLGQHDWMFQHVLRNHIGPTYAAHIVKAAVDAKGVDSVRFDFAEWVELQEWQIERKIKERKLKGLKPLTEAECQVKRFVTSNLVSHWLELIAAGQSIDNDAGWGFHAGIDLEKNELTVGNYKVKLDKEPTIMRDSTTSQQSWRRRRRNRHRTEKTSRRRKRVRRTRSVSWQLRARGLAFSLCRLPPNRQRRRRRCLSRRIRERRQPNLRKAGLLQAMRTLRMACEAPCL
jgi:hypothetical protein